MSTLIHNARVVTMNGDTVIERGGVVLEKDTITRVFEGDAPSGAYDDTFDAHGRVLMPGFVDAHTHACWAGDRLDEFDMKLRGATYLELLEAGGGIMSTVRAVRGASEDGLCERLLTRLNVMLREGTTTLEVKSGYGLTTQDELKMLRAITRAGEAWAGTLVPTALIAHALDPEQPDFVQTTCIETLRAVHEEFPGITIDAYTEMGAWSFDDTRRLFAHAMELGHPVRVHTDQFNELGMTRWAVEHGALSVDHLEATSEVELRNVARSKTYGVMLPCSGFQVDGRYADGRMFLDAAPGASDRLVIATNCNPGSAPTSSMPFAIALATRHLRITAHEALRACTTNAAALLGFDDRGALREGARADAVLLRHTDERMLGYEFGGNPVDAVWCGGLRIT